MNLIAQIKISLPKNNKDKKLRFKDVLVRIQSTLFFVQYRS